jgi:trans-aconitate methyltransferase
VKVERARESVVWHDVECGGYAADLPLWEELADAAGGPVLELGCGTGRVSLHLARRGHEVWGIDSDPELIAELRERGDRERLELHAEQAEASHFQLDRRFGLIMAPMQLIQLLPDRDARVRCLDSAAAHLNAGGTVALAIVEAGETEVPSSPLLPDVREVGSWVYSSQPLGAIRDADGLTVERLRQIVDPAGHLEESRDSVRLQLLSAAELEDEGRAAGLSPARRQLIEPTDSHVGSTVVRLEG